MHVGINIPENWKTCRLEETGEVVYGIQAAVANNFEPIGTRILTNKNITLDGSFELEKINYIELKTPRHKATILRQGDILFNWRSGSKEHVGKTAIFRLPGEYVHSSFILRIRPKSSVSGDYLFYFLRYLREAGYYLRMHSYAINAKFNKSAVNALPVVVPPLPEQKKIAHILSTVQKAIEEQERIIQTTTELKKALMQRLFTEGLRGEPQKETEIGLVSGSWNIPTIGTVCTIKASAMTYKQLEISVDVPDGVRTLGVKVSDMNLPGNEAEFIFANLERRLSEVEVKKRTVPRYAIVFPKRGAAIATNKKRLTTCWTVVDPNLIAVIPNDEVNHKYLYHWFNTFDLAKITDPGPTPQLNKKDIAPLKFPMPSIEEQNEIVKVIDCADAKLIIHERKKANFQDLFRTLLHELMTAKIRVHDIELPSLNKINRNQWKDCHDT